jgi:hypothetical protein
MSGFAVKVVFHYREYSRKYALDGLLSAVPGSGSTISPQKQKHTLGKSNVDFYLKARV